MFNVAIFLANTVNQNNDSNGIGSIHHNLAAAESLDVNFAKLELKQATDAIMPT